MATEGGLFSRQYIEQGAALSDSKRFRVRLAAGFHEVYPERDRHQMAKAIQLKLGIEVPSTNWGYIYSGFFENAEVRDVLDSITIIYELLSVNAYSSRSAAAWLKFVEGVFDSENLHYRIDAKGGVHRVLDTEHDRNRVSALSCLQAPRYAAVADALARAFAEIENTRPDAKNAVRNCFEATETLTKLLCDTNDALDKAFVDKRIRPLAQKTYGSDAATVSAAGRTVSGFGNWVDAAHPLRHGQKTETPVNLPDDLAILLISNGAAFIRWLVDVDRRTHEKS